MAYKCVNCGTIFEDCDIVYWEEDRGEFWGSRVYETLSGCPNCRGEYEETTPCEICGAECISDEISGGVCEDCIDKNRKNLEIWYKICKNEPKEKIEINPILAHLFDAADIERILLDYAKEKTDGIDCSGFIEEDISWFAEKLVEEVKK